MNRYLSIIFCFLFSFSFAQQITVDNTASVQSLIENTLIQGCVEVSNITSTSNGSSVGLSSFGYFERGTSNFPFENGIILSTGNANSAGNGQNNEILNEGTDTWTSDSDLETALGLSGTLNATAIEFNFTSISNQIQFNYILASEEYFGNFPCQYSDGFAFLIREAGSGNPYTNIAVVPGTSTPVNTNTVHDEIVGFCNAENGQYFEGYNVGDTNYNGRTTVLSAVATIQPNVQYQIKLVIADERDQNYDSAVFIEGSSFNATVDLGEDFSTCASNVVLDGNIENSQATYNWYYNDINISGANQPTFNALQTGNYRVEINIPLANGICTIEDDINLTLSSTQSSEAISDYNLCDDLSNDGIETFDLSTKDNEVLASVPTSDYTISYHYSISDAENGLNPIVAPIQNTINPQIIHVRIEDTANGCLAFSTIDLVVNSLPTIIDPTPLNACDDDSADGFAPIDLSVKDDEITNGQPNLAVSYHSTATDATLGINGLVLPYTNTNLNEQLFVSVKNTETGCISTTTLDITVLDNPVINTETQYIDACDGDLDGFANFDLTSITADVLQGLTGVTVTFHETIEDAQSGSNAIASDTNYSNTETNQQIVFIRVESNATGCASITPVEIHTNLLLTATNIRDMSICTDGNSGDEQFNFSSIAETIINDLPNITIQFYENEQDRDNQTNAINQASPYTPLSNPQTIYITLENLTCTEEANFDLIINPVQQFNPITNQTICDEDQDGFTTVNLSQFNTQVTNGLAGFSVTYFLTQEDADNNVNPLPNEYLNISNPFTVFPRISSDDTGCSDITSFEITVLEAPITSTPAEIIICDDDQDGFSIINLSDVITEVVTDTGNRTISFHNSLDEAENNSNAINTIDNYNAETEIVFIRVENSTTNCYTIEELSVIVNTLPNFTTISNYKICEDASDGVGDFIFETKDNEILNGQSGKQVFYYLNQSDADARINEIDKTTNYQNISNPQTIYVRVENIADQDCYGTSSFTLEVGTNPIFNEPSDWYVCDDISNDASEIFDLSVKIDEISQGIADNLSITFYTSLFNAQNSISPLPLNYTNTVNPQQIFVKIDNGTICNSITSFQLNVIQAPNANESQPIIQCDDETVDGFNEFDITIAEFEILDVRQDNIVISYYENLEDAEANINAITNPENYTNTSNPQTVYIKLTNTLSDCSTNVPIELVVNMPPTINNFQTFNICENETNSFDLNEVNPVLINQSFNVLFSYYSSKADALSETNALDTNYMYQTNNDTIFARVEYSTTHCFDIHEFTLNVNPLPIAHQPNNLVVCDDDFDGLLELNLTQQNSSILNGQNSNNFTVTYHNTELQANQNTNVLDVNYTAYNNEIIYVRVENSSTGCYDITQFAVTINPLPVIDLEDQVICLDNLPLLVSANTNNLADQYLWSTGQITPEIEITEQGTYWVTVTSEFGCENTRVFSVSESEAATIEVTETIDFSDPNNITVTISGIGNYLYQLDNFPPQESNVFQNVAMGYHTITIIDLNGCSNVTKEVLVIDTPKFMTPNNDGDFDTWHIIGVETLPGTIIHIYDRYGKQLAKLNHNSPGWNGTYNGKPMPASDYWFLAKVKRGNIAFDVKGHFALRR